MTTWRQTTGWQAITKKNILLTFSHIQQRCSRWLWKHVWKISLIESIFTEKGCENIVTKEEIAHQDWTIFPFATMFAKLSAAGTSEIVCMWEMFNTLLSHYQWRNRCNVLTVNNLPETCPKLSYHHGNGYQGDGSVFPVK